MQSNQRQDWGTARRKAIRKANRNKTLLRNAILTLEKGFYPGYGASRKSYKAAVKYLVMVAARTAEILLEDEPKQDEN